jgi:type IV pilus assembly protein PilW
MKTARRTESGISLVELMVALTIGLLLTVSIGYIFSGSLQIFRVQGESARIQETGRFLLDALGRQITQAGYAAISPDYTDTKTSFAGTPISGEHGVAGTRAAERKAGSDYLAVSFDSSIDCQGGAVASGTARNEFYLNANDQLICASGGGAGQVLADGVETFLVQYGVDVNGDNSVDRYYVTPPNDAAGNPDFSTVKTVRVCVVVHAFSAGTSTVAQHYQDCSGTTQTAPDTRLRRVLGATFQLRNRGS